MYTVYVVERYLKPMTCSTHPNIKPNHRVIIHSLFALGTRNRFNESYVWQSHCAASSCWRILAQHWSIPPPSSRPAYFIPVVLVTLFLVALRNMHNPLASTLTFPPRRFCANLISSSLQHEDAGDQNQFPSAHMTFLKKGINPFLKDLHVAKHFEDGYSSSKSHRFSSLYQLSSFACNVRNNIYVVVFFSCLLMLLCQLGYVMQTVTDPPEPSFHAVRRSPLPVVAPAALPTPHLRSYDRQKDRTRNTFSEHNLIKSLQFTNMTTLNFFHLHKTGGTSIKVALQDYYSGKLKANGEKVTIEELCYSRKDPNTISGEATFLSWRCDWLRLEASSLEERDKRDIAQGHQFLLHGISELIPHRNIRTFTVLRHPFDRKFSFFFHFFVRAVHREDSDVSWEELRDFLVYSRVHIDADLGRDAGPNYIAGRMLSDGEHGFVGDYSNGHFAVPDAHEDQVVRSAIEILRSFVFVGIQKDPQATFCLLRRTVRAFDAAHGIVDPANSRALDSAGDRLNSGSYRPSAADAWSKLSDGEKREFERNERVDLRIFREAERLFQEQISSFGCNSPELQNMSRFDLKLSPASWLMTHWMPAQRVCLSLSVISALAPVCARVARGCLSGRATDHSHTLKLIFASSWVAS